MIFIIHAAGGNENETISIVAGGDIMLGSWAQETILRESWDYPFANIDSLLFGSDIVMANLEAPFGSSGEAFRKTYTFRVSPDLVNVLVAGRINVVNLANNHILDFGLSALEETFKTLNNAHIHFIGAGENLLEARQPAVITRKGKRIAVAGYSLTFPEAFWATDTSAGTCFPSHTFFYDDIRKFKKESDLVIVNFHWGGELMTSPKDYQKKIAHGAIKAGADLVLGHHPHVVQGIEIYKGKIIAYSLGNFIFGSYSDSIRDGMLLKYFYETNDHVKCKIYPINVNNKIVEFQPKLLMGEDKHRFIKELQNLSTELNPTPDVISSDGWLNIF